MRLHREEPRESHPSMQDSTRVKERTQNLDPRLVPGAEVTRFTTESVISEFRPLAPNKSTFPCVILTRDLVEFI